MSGLVATEQILGEPCSAPALVLFQPTCLPCTISPTKECMLLEGNAPQALIQAALDLVTQCML
jgi:hypothetical protein